MFIRFFIMENKEWVHGVYLAGGKRAGYAEMGN
jgi:hypothetical protein